MLSNVSLHLGIVFDNEAAILMNAVAQNVRFGSKEPLQSTYTLLNCLNPFQFQTFHLFVMNIQYLLSLCSY